MAQSIRVPVNVHVGKSLLSAARQYETMLDVILEGVQNSLDAGAGRIWIHLNQRLRWLRIADDGKGVTRQEMDERLQNFFHSAKQQDKLGTFGLGFISPLGKCPYFTFTAGAESDPSAGYHEWLFDTEEIASRKQDVEVNRKELPHLRYGADATDNHPSLRKWRTELVVPKYTSDKSVAKVTAVELVTKIRGRYGEAMRRYKTQIFLRITDENGRITSQTIAPPEFEGEPLPKVTLTDPRVGNVTFRLYLAPQRLKAKKKSDQVEQLGVVLREEGRPFRLDFSTFATTHVEKIGNEVVVALKSGIFEGELLHEARLVLREDRRGFLKTEALDGLCAVLSRWFEEYGRALLQNSSASSEREHNQQLCRAAERAFRQLMKLPEFSDIKGFIDQMGLSTVGGGHKRRRVIGTLSLPTLSDAVGRTGDGQDGSVGAEKSTPQSERTGMIHLLAGGPSGQVRQVVKGGSPSIIFLADSLAGTPREDHLWHFDGENGILVFNSRYPDWVACCESRNADRLITYLTNFVAVNVFRLYGDRERQNFHEKVEFFDHSLQIYCFILLHGDQLAKASFSSPTLVSARKRSKK